MPRTGLVVNECRKHFLKSAFNISVALGVDGVVFWCSLGWTGSLFGVLLGGRGRSVMFSGVDGVVLWCSLGWTGSFGGVLWGGRGRSVVFSRVDVSCHATRTLRRVTVVLTE